MPLYGVLADIHGNHEALTAALRFLDGLGARAYLCLGDIVGYNADPDLCVATVRGRGMQAVAGNHDLITIHRLGFGRCSRKAAHALRRTRRRLRPESAAYLRELAPRMALPGGIVLVHAGLDDVELYVRTPGEVARNAAALAVLCPGARVCFFGHTHDQRVWEVRGGSVEERAAAGAVSLRHDALYFINPGSVDGARKAGPRRAECALFDSEAWTVAFASVPYDHEAAERKARRAGYRQGAWASRLAAALRRIRPSARA